MSSNSVIDIRDLRKSYGSAEVLHGIDLQIPPGRLTGFLGPNGAGKTTTLRILMGLIQPSHGEVTILGRELGRDRGPFRRQIGYLPAEVRFPRRMTGRRALRLYAAARRVRCGDAARRLASALQLDLDLPVRRYSTGMKQKLGLIQAMMHSPRLLILDEPTTGLDPLVRSEVFLLLRQHVRDGGSVLFSSHSLNEVEQLCDDVILLRRGHVMEHQSIVALRTREMHRVTLDWDPHLDASPTVPDCLQLVDCQATRWSGLWSGGIQSLVQWLGKVPVRDATIEKPGLDDLFRTWYRHDTAAADRAEDGESST